MDTGAVYVTLSGRVSLLKTQVSIPLVTWTHTHQFPRHTENWMGIQVGGIPEKKLAVPGIHNVWGNTNNCRKDKPKVSASTLENRGSQIWKKSHLVSILRTIQNPLLFPLNSLWICWLALLQVHFGERWNTKLTLRNAVAGNKGSSRILQRRNVVLESVSFLGTNWREPIPEGCTNPDRHCLSGTIEEGDRHGMRIWERNTVGVDPGRTLGSRMTSSSWVWL